MHILEWACQVVVNLFQSSYHYHTLYCAAQAGAAGDRVRTETGNSKLSPQAQLRKKANIIHLSNIILSIIAVFHTFIASRPANAFDKARNGARDE